MKIKGVQCSRCHEIIWSRHRHDWRKCKCGGTFVDGGRDYLRYGTDDDGVQMPDVVDVEIDSAKALAGAWGCDGEHTKPTPGGGE